MPETRIVSTTYGVGGFDPTKPNNNIVEERTKVISDAELAEEAEIRTLAKADQLYDAVIAEINAATNLTQAKAAMKDLCVLTRRVCIKLINKGLLP